MTIALVIMATVAAIQTVWVVFLWVIIGLLIHRGRRAAPAV